MGVLENFETISSCRDAFSCILKPKTMSFNYQKMITFFRQLFNHDLIPISTRQIGCLGIIHNVLLTHCYIVLHTINNNYFQFNCSHISKKRDIILELKDEKFFMSLNSLIKSFYDLFSFSMWRPVGTVRIVRNFFFVK